MDESRRLVVGLIAIVAILGLLLFARGEPGGGRGATAPTALVADTVA
jgi:hypothetical protein